MVHSVFARSSIGSTRRTFTKGKSVNKSQLVEALSNHFEGNKNAAKQALEAVLETITREITKGEKVAITGSPARRAWSATRGPVNVPVRRRQQSRSFVPELI